MARQPRVFLPGLLYHVIARGNQRKRTFVAPADYAAYLARLTRYRERYAVTLYAYCLMPNHVHLLLQTSDMPLAKFMQGVQQSYTQYFNRVYHQVGHLFQGRYKAIVCETDAYLVTLVRYIHLNPVRAGLVDAPEDYEHSGHQVYLCGHKTPLLDPTPVLELIGGPTAYQGFVRRGVGMGHAQEYYHVEDQRFLGSSGFGDRVKVQAGQGPGRGSKPPLDDALAELSRRFGVDLEALRGPDRSRDVARVRAFVAFALVRRLGYRVSDVAAALGRDIAGVSNLVSRLPQQRRSDPGLSRDVIRPT